MLTPTTELDAINIMLASIGESPVSSVEGNGLVDAVIAKQTLDATSREVQSRGWHFNIDKNVLLSPTYPYNYIELPSTTLRIDSVNTSKNIDVVQRGNRLYKPREQSFVFEEPIEVDMVVLLGFDLLPEVARNYITLKAARVFQQRVVGSQELAAFTELDETRARVALNELEAENGDYNILSGNYSVARVLQRWN